LHAPASRLQVDPIYSFQGHIIYAFRQGYGRVSMPSTTPGGGRPSTARARKGLENACVGLTLSLPINPHNSVKLYGSSDVYSRTDSKFVIVGIAWQFRWGAGL
jgi:hypothetical protein